MYAEYGDQGPSGPVKQWHMVQGEKIEGLCGRALALGSATREPTEWGRTAEPCCRSCGVVWFQSVPFLADEHDRSQYLPQENP
ncbi:hypothetical protein OG455_20600 [Kitasatospora sp. NBC_01287]|uniref:hypothetical protein n=1 Tax=Kitasatospora sp. NBC_01287 TaxID=2903573 RepID=UPI00224FFD87|nr:hypothetical protein [Kitasatospora sp. NBC_01287]MCX4747888.1 hypothetical protein [Kitasatospora sp. NBC_01287]